MMDTQGGDGKGSERKGGGKREKLPLFHVLFDQQVVVSCSCLVSAIAKIGAHINSVLVLVVMDTTT